MMVKKTRSCFIGKTRSIGACTINDGEENKEIQRNILVQGGGNKL